MDSTGSIRVRESFWNVYRPGCLEHYVLKSLRNDPDFVPELDFVMEKDGSIIGQNTHGYICGRGYQLQIIKQMKLYFCFS